jgi:transcription initiation factor TFIID subunit 5
MQTHQEDIAKAYFNKFKNRFLDTHTADMLELAQPNLQSHIESSKIAKTYFGNRYRITINQQAYYNLLIFLEDKDKQGGTVILKLLQERCMVRDTTHGSTEKTLIQQALQQGTFEAQHPNETDGIPGHDAGSVHTDTKNVKALQRLKLGGLPMDPELVAEVREYLADEDARKPPKSGKPTFTDHFEAHIKREANDDSPAREEIPLPPYTGREIAMEVTKVRENRDRFKIESQTGGIGPGANVSVCMFTLMNSYDR